MTEKEKSQLERLAMNFDQEHVESKQFRSEVRHRFSNIDAKVANLEKSLLAFETEVRTKSKVYAACISFAIAVGGVVVGIIIR